MNMFFGTEWTELTGINTIPARSGSSAHSGRGGSSPPSRTIFKTQSRKILGLFYFTANYSGMIDLKEITLSGVWSVLSEQLSERATNPAPLRKSPISQQEVADRHHESDTARVAKRNRSG